MTSSSSDRRPGEFELIAELFAPLSKGAPGAFDLTDDAAVLAPPPGHELVLKTDAIVEGVHFFRTDPPGAIAQKALRVNLSDLAAKGAEPAGYLMALLLPDWPDKAWLHAFADGLAADQATFGLSLMGGDTSATPGPLAVSISAFGFVPAGAMIRRAGAQPGDLVFVSGTIGDAGGGLAVLKGNRSVPELVARYRLPEPRLALGPALRGIASASLDVSDGLMADLGHIAEVSKVRIEVDAARIPLSKALRSLWGDGADVAASARRRRATTTRSRSPHPLHAVPMSRTPQRGRVSQFPRSVALQQAKARFCLMHRDARPSSRAADTRISEVIDNGLLGCLCHTSLMRIVSLIVLALLVASFTHALAGTTGSHEPGTSVEMPYLIAPVVVNGRLDSNAYVSSRVVASSATATIVVRGKLPFIQDAYVRDVNGMPIGKANEPATVDVPALTARLLADAKRVAGPNLVSSVEIIRIQVAPLHPGTHS